MDAEHRVVSSDSEELILVDSDDTEIGHLNKASSHDGNGVLHRAFSIFLFDSEGTLLLQQRSSGKRLWPLYWSNSCCSHPRKGESMAQATNRRLMDELGVTADLEFMYKFQYQASFGELGSENELCSVFLGRINGPTQVNENEIAAVRFLTNDALQTEFRSDTDQFTPWFKMEWTRLQSDFAESMSKYLTSARA